MVVALEQRVQREHVYAIVDEVDSSSSTRRGRRSSSRARWATRATQVRRAQPRRWRAWCGGRRRWRQRSSPRPSGSSPPRRRSTTPRCALQGAARRPKNKRLLKLMQETGVKQLVQKMELAHIADRKLPGAAAAVPRLEDDLLFVLDEKGHSVHLTDRAWTSCRPTTRGSSCCPTSPRRSTDRAGSRPDAAGEARARRAARGRVRQKSEKLHIIHQLLQAHALYEKDVNYVVQDGPGAHRGRVHRPHDAGPSLVRGPAPGGRGQGGACR
jgi:preprotein translocase subunit SecA